MRKLVACLAVRNGGLRLYGKPLQCLDTENGLTVIQYIIQTLKKNKSIIDIVLAISEGIENKIYEQIAIDNKINFIIGDENDVLGRLIKACQHSDGTDIFRITTESPFTYFEIIDDAWEAHVKGDRDITVIDNLPDGCGFEITKLSAYQFSWINGSKKHRSELCSLYIRENKKLFNLYYFPIKKELMRIDLRLTIDYPEDLILCRQIYKNFKNLNDEISLHKIIEFLDKNIDLKKIVEPFVEEGMKTMYL